MGAVWTGILRSQARVKRGGNCKADEQSTFEFGGSSMVLWSDDLGPLAGLPSTETVSAGWAAKDAGDRMINWTLTV